MATSDPRKQKALGRAVKGFDPIVWDKVGYEVVVQGNLAKFRQNPDFREVLLATGDRVRTSGLCSWVLVRRDVCAVIRRTICFMCEGDSPVTVGGWVCVNEGYSLCGHAGVSWTT